MDNIMGFLLIGFGILYLKIVWSYLHTNNTIDICFIFSGILLIVLGFILLEF